MKISESRKRANEKYAAEKVEDIRFRVPKGQKQIVQDFAAKRGMSTNAFIWDLIQREMAKENESEEDQDGH